MTHFVLYKDSSLVRSNARSITTEGEGERWRERGGDKINRGRQRLRERQRHKKGGNLLQRGTKTILGDHLLWGVVYFVTGPLHHSNILCNEIVLVLHGR